MEKPNERFGQPNIIIIPFLLKLTHIFLKRIYIYIANWLSVNGGILVEIFLFFLLYISNGE